MHQKTKDQIIDELRQQIVVLEAERKHAEQAALEAKRYLARLIETSPDTVISSDKEGNVDLSKVFAGLIIVAGTGIIITVILQRIERRFQAWKPPNNT